MTDPKTITKDIYDLLELVCAGETVEVPYDVEQEFGRVVGDKLRRALEGRSNDRRERVLYMSEAGRPCIRQLWYKYRPEEYPPEPLQPHNLIKFLYGDILEEIVLLLVRLSGHEVTEEQKECEIELENGWKVRGRLDAKIDGEVVDVKSASTYGFQKFKNHEVAGNDNFGYIRQLELYNVAEKVSPESLTSFLAIDKQNGHITKDTYWFNSSEESVKKKLTTLTNVIESEELPERGFDDEPERKSGNRKLGIACSYCPYKFECWSDTNNGEGLKGFAYSRGPVWLTKVVSTPKVPELNYD